MISRKMGSCGPTGARCHTSPRTHIPHVAPSWFHSASLKANLWGGGSFLGSQSILWGSSAPGWPPMMRVPLPGAGLALGGCSECIGGCTGAHRGCSWWAGECSVPGTTPPHTHLLFQTTRPRQSFSRHGGKLWGAGRWLHHPDGNSNPASALHPLHFPVEGVT